MNTSRHSFHQWPIDLLIDYALKIHHRGIREKGPKLLELIRRNMSNDPVLAQVEPLFSDSLMALNNHLMKEENVLFPYLYDLIDAHDNNIGIAPMHCGTIANPIQVMMMEHGDELARHEQIATLTSDYTAPKGATIDYCNIMAGLKDFVADLQEHIYIENEIIFAKSQELENKIVGIV